MPERATYFAVLPSPIGELTLVGGAGRLEGLYMTDHRHRPPLPAGCTEDASPFARAAAQLEAYFAGELQEFDIHVEPAGTEFQRTVWQALLGIPYGATTTYGELAARIGRPKASRAVGLANGRNPVSIIVPCHRVIGADGSLTGYGGGLERKSQLLALERRVAGAALV